MGLIFFLVISGATCQAIKVFKTAANYDEFKGIFLQLDRLGLKVEHFTDKNQRCMFNRYCHCRRGKKLISLTRKFANFTGKKPVNSWGL